MLGILQNFLKFANVQIFQNVAEVVNFHCCNFSHRYGDLRVAVNFPLTCFCIGGV